MRENCVFAMKTKELIIYFRRKKEDVFPVIIMGQQIEIVQSYKYLGVYLDTEVVFKKAQSRLFFLRKLRSFDISKKLLHVFYQRIFNAVLCWGGSITVDDKNRINKMIRKAGLVISLTPDSLEVTGEKRTRAKLKSVLYFELFIVFLMESEAHSVSD